MRPAHSRAPPAAAAWPAPAFQYQLAGRGVLARLFAGQGVQPQGLLPVRVRFGEGHPPGQGFEGGPVEVHLELIARLGVEARLGVQTVDVGVDVHDEHRAARAGKHVQVVEVQLAGLSGQRRVEMVRHGDVPFFLLFLQAGVAMSLP